ncbi:hypothetical protein [Streptomyces sp. NPDC088178]
MTVITQAPGPAHTTAELPTRLDRQVPDSKSRTAGLGQQVSDNRSKK